MLARAVFEYVGRVRLAQYDRLHLQTYALAEHPGGQYVMAAEAAHRHDLRRAAPLRVIQQRPELSHFAPAVDWIRRNHRA